MFTKGHIVLKRSVKEKGWYYNANTLAVMIHLLVDAQFKDDDHLKRGQILIKKEELAKDCNLTYDAIRTAFKSLGASGEVRTERCGRMTLVTICNYDSYQDASQDNPNIVPDSSQDNPNEIPITSQTILEQGIKETGNKENKKKLSNDSKEKRFVPPSVEEVQEYADSIGFNLDAGYFVDFYAANGWKQKGGQKLSDWKAAVRNWQRMDAKREQTTLFAPTDDWHDESRVYYKQDFIDNEKMPEYFALDADIQNRLSNGSSVVWRNGKFVLPQY